MAKDLKSYRAMLRQDGVFYTDERLAQLLKSYMPPDLTEVYDPTCGNGNLLAVFPDKVKKYGQELDAEQAAECAARLVNCCIKAGDTLEAPQFAGRRFRGIMGNPPFSVKWNPATAYRFDDWPEVLPPPSRADYAFLLHCLSMLADDGVAAVLNFPGVTYRGQREGQIREWMVRRNVIDEVMQIEGDYFVDTKVATVLIVLKKNRQTTAIKFRDRAKGLERDVPFGEVEANGFNLSPQCYLAEPEEEKPQADPWELEQNRRTMAVRSLRTHLRMSETIAWLEGWGDDPEKGVKGFVKDIETEVEKFK